MRKVVIGSVVGLMVLGLAFSGAAKQEIDGKFSDTSRILFLNQVVADQDPCAAKFEPLVRVVKVPFAGTRDPIVLQVDFPHMLDVYLYLALNVPGRGDVVYYAGTKINPRLFITVPAPPEGWGVGTQVVKVILTTCRLWEVRSNTLVSNSYCCCCPVEVEQVLIVTNLPPSPPCYCPCSCNISTFIGVVAGMILYPILFCGCP